MSLCLVRPVKEGITKIGPNARLLACTGPYSPKPLLQSYCTFFSSYGNILDKKKKEEEGLLNLELCPSIKGIITCASYYYLYCLFMQQQYKKKKREEESQLNFWNCPFGKGITTFRHWIHAYYYYYIYSSSSFF